MDRDDLDYFETVLHERIDEAESDLERIGDASAPIAPDVSIGRLSRLDAMQMQEMALEQERRIKARIKNLREAIDRIAKGTFGRCSNCGEGIEFTRLQAQPETMTCSRCLARFR